MEFWQSVFFKLENREVICSIIKNTNDRENFRILLRDINVMLSVCLSSKSGVNIEKLRQLGIDLMSHLRTKFLASNGNAWILINPSLHSMCAHSWQLYQICSSSISVYSEQAQEHWNKFVASFKSGVGARARQHSVKVNLLDIFSRMLIMTHPVVATKHREIKCSVCNDLGHTARSKIHANSYGPYDEDQSLINDCYL
ncbi:unnamed protein product [Meganyctiphanes norvegica]|uniref:Uncharacterized protein n=1 Tax=Meganyctiphanes norvegica TaxID=48144 RepID=A0AAV2SR71_MEGNR